MSTVDISGLDIHDVVRALWRETNFIGTPLQIVRHIPSATPKEPSNQEIDEALKMRSTIDYIAGKPIKTDFSNIYAVDPFYYDRDAGKGKFQDVINTLRNK